MAIGDALSNDGPKWKEVRDAFKEYDHPEKLGLSRLADMPLVEAGLVLDPYKPTLKEWGVALQLVLEWAVEQLAPPPEILRVLTWRDAPWQQYLLLYYRYVALFLPEDWDKPVPLSPPKVRNYLGEERETRGLVKALIRLMGLQDQAAFYQIEEGAFRAVARLLMGEEKLARAKRVKKKALEHYCTPLLAEYATRTLLFIAATFEEPFPADWLLAIAEKTQVVDAEKTLDRLLGGRILHRGDNGYLHLSIPLRRYLQKQHLKRCRDASEQAQYHREVLAYYRGSRPIQAAWHLYHYLPTAEVIIMVVKEGQQTLAPLTRRLLLRLWKRLKQDEAPQVVWVEFQRVCSEHFRLEHRDKALAACEHGLRACDADPERAGFFHHHRGKLYEESDHQTALSCYAQALDCFKKNPTNQSQVLKDRGWIWIFQEEWDKAKQDLTDALGLVGSEAWGQKANIHDVFAALYREQAGSIEVALEHAYCALALRKKIGDRERVAYSYNALGRIYKKKKEWRTSRKNYLKAARIFKNLGRRAELATVYLNLGALVYEQRNYQRAVKWYQRSLDLFGVLNLRLGQVQAHYNLAEGYAKLGKFTLGLLHWHLGNDLCQQKPTLGEQVKGLERLDNQLEKFQKLATEHPDLHRVHLGKEGLKVMCEVQRKGSIKRAEAIALLQRRRESWVRRLLNRLVKAELLTPLPSGPTTRYFLTD